MSRISRVGQSQVGLDIAALFDKVFAQRGNVRNMLRVMAHLGNPPSCAPILDRPTESEQRFSSALRWPRRKWRDCALFNKKAPMRLRRKTLGIVGSPGSAD